MKTKSDNAAYKALRKASADGSYKKLYLFHGEEKYLLEYYLGKMRSDLVAAGTEDFNHKRFDGKKVDFQELADAIDAFPAFSEHTLIEISDFDIFKCPEDDKQAFIKVLSDIPDYACVVFVYDTIEFKADSRVKVNAALKNLFEIVNFELQEQADLLNWIYRRFKALGKSIERDEASYLAFITGGLMTTLVTEIEKVAAYEKTDAVSKKSIDAVVVPVLDAVTYKMTDAILHRRFNDAAGMLSDLLRMQEAPHRIIYNISLKMRQLLAARVCCESGKGISDLMSMCNMNMEFQARGLMTAARGVSADFCRHAVLLCSQAAVAMNSSGSAECERILSQLLAQLAVTAGAR